MPNPVRLHRLIQLRRSAGLTQADMAQRCGLQGAQSRKTVSAWETGEMIPHASRRVDFMHYLWRDLGLRQNPALFEESWAILVEEWGWEPLHEREWAVLVGMPLSPSPNVADEKENSEAAASAALNRVDLTTVVAPTAVACNDNAPRDTPDFPIADDNHQEPLGADASVAVYSVVPLLAVITPAATVDLAVDTIDN